MLDKEESSKEIHRKCTPQAIWETTKLVEQGAQIEFPTWWGCLQEDKAMGPQHKNFQNL